MVLRPRLEFWAAALPWISAAAPAVASLAGNLISSSSASSTNQQMMDFNAQQAQLNRQFQASEQVQAEDWNKMMSDTAEQRRVSDLKAAGLNPALSVMGMGAASAPTMSAPSGSSASAQLQNPGAAFGQLGSQASSAVAAAMVPSQIKANVAMANKAQSEADYTAGPQSEQSRAQTEVLRQTSDLLIPAQAKAAEAAGQLDQKQKDRIQQQISSGDIAANVQLVKAQTTTQGFIQQLDKMDALLKQYQGIELHYAMPFLIRQIGTNLSLSEMALPQARAAAAYFSNWVGQHSFEADQARQWINTGANVMKGIGALTGRGGGGMTMAPDPMGKLPILSELPQ